MLSDILQAAEQSFSLFRDGAWMCLHVVDTGGEIAPEHLPNIFRFYLVKNLIVF